MLQALDRFLEACIAKGGEVHTWEATPGAASDSPYPCLIETFNPLYTTSIRSLASGAADECTIRKEPRAYFSKRGCLARRSIPAGQRGSYDFILLGDLTE